MTSIVTILQNFVKLACLKVAFPEIGFFRDFGLQFTVQNCFDFVPTYMYQLLVIPFVVFMPLICLKNQMPLTVNFGKFSAIRQTLLGSLVKV